MSYLDIARSLVTDITDPAVRMDILATLNYIREVYLLGNVSEDEIRTALRDIVNTVLESTRPELTEEQRAELVDRYVDQLMRALRLEGIRFRTIRARRT